MAASVVVASGARTLEGTVMATSPGSLFVMARSGDHLEVAVPSSARVVRNGEDASLEELQPQDQVAVRLSDDGKSATDVVARTPY